MDFDPQKKDFLLTFLGWEKILGTALGILLISFVASRLRSLTDRMAKKWNSRRLILLQIRSVVVFIFYFAGAWIITRHVWGLSHEGLLPAYQLRAKVVVQDFMKEKLCLTALTLKVHELFQQNKILRPLSDLLAERESEGNWSA